MNRNPRNQSLLARLAETNQFKPLAERAFAIGSDLDRAVAAVAADGRLSAQGKREQAQRHLEKARADLLALQKPIDDHRRQTEKLHSEKKKPAFDKTDYVAALNRQEYRAASRGMTFGQKAMRLIGPKRSTAFIDATIFEFEDDPWMGGGFDLDIPGEREIYEAAREERLRDLNPSLIDALAVRAAVEAEVMMVLDIVRADLASDATQLGRAA